ncbi:calcium-binding protein [Paracoccus subflavus]|uniref:Calcium-binding protein n=1 Tax=Paracoccus subflavus TaxID=2528244 RepID=A0A4Q9FWQ8_9RHOB|nr:calcium-binding protein [Paracoccus subflavus]TBN37754.1 calcium-binding protein [Paracoccus subflavus]
MARLMLTARYNGLDDWPGRLLEAEGATIFNARTATSFVFTYPAGHDFAGFRVAVTGTGFAYSDGMPTAGNIARVVVSSSTGQPVLTFDSFPTNTLASDLSQFAASVFGARNALGIGPRPNGEGAWSMLLSGADVINGTNGNDRRSVEGFNSGNDRFNMLAGDDSVAGGIGNDTIFGGSGFDEISFERTTHSVGDSAFRGISVNMATGKLIDCWGGTDTFFSIERIIGSRFNDVFIGNADRNDFAGLRGNDVFNGGGDHRDRVRYGDDYWQGGRQGIVVDLETSNIGGVIRGTIRDGFGNRDTVINIERVNGTRYNDVFVGSSERNAFVGAEGRDVFNGMGSRDAISFDVGYTGVAQTGIVVNLRLAANQIRNDGFGNIETALSIEDIWASEQNDRLIMNGADNFVFGRDGADTMTGGGGNDTFAWEDGDEFASGDRITDFIATGAPNIDRLAFAVDAFDNMTTTLRLVNGASATSAAGIGQFVFNSANDTLFWDRNGSAAGGVAAVVVLTGVNALTSANFDLF